MSGTDSRHSEIFEHAPIALFEVDYSEVIAAVNALVSGDIGDLREHLDAHLEVVATLASRARIVDANHCARALFGVESAAELPSSITELLAESEPVLSDWLVSLGRGEVRFRSRAQARVRGGKHMPVAVEIKSLSDRRRGLISVVDRSECEHLTVALQDTRRALEQSSSELSEFAYVASHDLQEPLRVVSSYAQLLDKRYGDHFDDRGTKYLNYIVDGARRMQGLIGDLLTLSRVGTQGKRFEPTALTEVVDDVIARANRADERQPAKFTCSELPIIMADPAQMRQLFAAVIDNALKFRAERAPHIQIVAERCGDSWQLTVADNGIGIEEKYLTEVFSPFRRLHGRADYPGTGMGLAVARKIVDRHGGRIWAESRPSEGSTFYIVLPAADSELAT